jgi:hypothetical protein
VISIGVSLLHGRFPCSPCGTEAAVVVPASTHENRACELMLEHLTR